MTFSRRAFIANSGAAALGHIGRYAVPRLSGAAAASLVFASSSKPAEAFILELAFITQIFQAIKSAYNLYAYSTGTDQDLLQLDDISRNISAVAANQTQILDTLNGLGMALNKELAAAFRDRDAARFNAMALQFERLRTGRISDRNWLNSMTEEADRLGFQLGTYDPFVYPSFAMASSLQIALHQMRGSSPLQIMEVLDQERKPLQRWLDEKNPDALPALIKSMRSEQAVFAERLKPLQDPYALNQYVVLSGDGNAGRTIASYGHFLAYEGVSKDGNPILTFSKQWVNPYTVPDNPGAGLIPKYRQANGTHLFADVGGTPGINTGCLKDDPQRAQKIDNSSLATDDARFKAKCITEYYKTQIAGNGDLSRKLEALVAIQASMQNFASVIDGMAADMKALVQKGYGSSRIGYCGTSRKTGECIPLITRPG